MSERETLFGSFRRKRAAQLVTDREGAKAKIVRAREEGGALREAIIRGHGCCSVNDPEFDLGLWSEALRAQERAVEVERVIDQIRRYAEQGRFAAIKQTLERLPRG